MDISRQYFDMCSRAFELQETYIKLDNGFFKKGDFFFEEQDQYDPTHIIVGTGQEKLCNSKAYNITWLPRQDQLQEMVNNHDLKIIGHKMQPVSILALFSKWVFDPGLLMWVDISLEAMWLLYVMETVYSKAWNQETKSWITINTES